MQSPSSSSFAFPSLLLKKELLERRKAVENLQGFTRFTKAGFRDAEFHRKIYEPLDRVVRGELKRVMILLPPRHSKSEFGSRRLPAFYMGKHPDHQIISTSATSPLSIDFGRDVRNIVSGTDFKAAFPNVYLRKDSKAAGRWHTNKGGIYIAASVAGAILGKGANLGIIDDPHASYDDAQSLVKTQNIWDWYGTDFYSRLMPDAAIVIIMQRLSTIDLAGRLLDQMAHGGDQWHVVQLPAVDDRGGQIPLEKGTPLWPSDYPIKRILAIKNAADMGDRKFNAIWQQRPSKLEGNIIRREWIRYWLTLPKQFDEVCLSGDLAFKGKGDSSFVVFQVWGRLGADKYLIDQLRAQMEYVDSKKAIRSILSKYAHYQIRKKWIEDKANGPAIESDLKHEIPGLIMVEPDKDKANRMRSTEGEWQAGNVYLPSPQVYDWVEGMVDRLLTFPDEPNDEGDAASQALNQFAAYKGGILAKMNRD